MAKNASPTPRFRLSMEMPATAMPRSPPRRAPPLPRTMSPIVNAGMRGPLCRSPGEGGPGLGSVVEGEHLGADDLIGLMALAGDDDHVAGAGPGQRALYSGLPVRKCLMPVHYRAAGD